MVVVAQLNLGGIGAVRMHRTLGVAVCLGVFVVGVQTARAADVVVGAPGGARAVVVRDPLRVSFVDASGRTVLSQAAPAGGSGVVAPVPEVQFGTLSPPPAALYAPFSFLVGARTMSQTPAGQWQGTLQQVTEGGRLYAATKVLGTSVDGAGTHLTLATSDPSGRTLDVLIGARGSALQLSARPVPPDGVVAMSDAFVSPPGEAFHGFGGRHDAVDLRGSEFFTYLQQENVGSGSAQGLTAATSPGQDRYMFPNGPYATYYAQSQFVSSAGYGFWLNRDEIARWRLGTDRPDAWHVEVGAPAIDYVVAPGEAARAMGTLSSLTGRQAPPPRWALGTLLDREVQYPSDDPVQHQAEIAGDIAALDQYGVKLDGYRIEGAAELPRDVLARDIAELRRRGIHPMVYFRGFVGRDTTGTDTPQAYDEAIAKGYVATHADGSPYTYTSNFNADGAVIDFTNPAAVSWWQARIRAALDAGADGFMQDFGEQVFDDMHFKDGSTGAQMHNRFPILFHRATVQAVGAYRTVHPERQIFWFTRSGYSGSASYEPANFPGDETTDWTRSSGLASQTTDMLNRAIGGAYGFTTDIGGYFDLGPYQPTSKELFIRWAQWAALSPFFRVHGSLSAGTHTPWSYDPETLRIYKAMAALHRQAAPLILSLWREAAATGVPPTRPLWLQSPGDTEAAKQDQEWMLGPNVLVAPIVSEGVTARTVYFPAGCWTSPQTGAVRIGPLNANVTATIQQLPYYVRCGSHPFEPFASTGPGGAGKPTRRGRCARRKRLRFAVHQNNGRVTQVRVYVGKRLARTVKARRVRAVSINAPRAEAFTVKIVAYTVRHTRVISRRRFHGCIKGRPRTRVQHHHRLPSRSPHLPVDAARIAPP